MSRYQVDYYGEITFKSGTADERIDAFIDRLSEDCGVDEDRVETNQKPKTISFDGFSGYDDMEILALLTEYESDMLSGCIEYTGEDHQHWKHELDPAVGHWKLHEGYVAYEEEGKLLSEIFDETIKEYPRLYERYRPRNGQEV